MPTATACGGDASPQNELLHMLQSHRAARDDQRVVIIGAGPAGLASAHELCQAGLRPLVLERDDVVGGLSRTVVHNGYRFDIGGHRFFTRIPEIENAWQELMGEDFLVRERLSSIFFRGRMIDYPLRAASALRALGVIDSARAMGSYVAARLRPGPDDSFEGWVINRFGRRLYQHFFKSYTEKVWGMPCSELSADWAAQRIKSLTLWGAIKDALTFPRTSEHTTLLRSFNYPRLGPGMLYQRQADAIVAGGGRILTGREVVEIAVRDGTVVSVTTTGPDGDEVHPADAVISTMPLGELVGVTRGIEDDNARQAAGMLKHRGFLTAGLIVDRAVPFRDQWIYIHEPDVAVGRVQIYNNWSPEMVPDADRSAIGAEYFAWPTDDMWSAPDEEIIELATRELDQLGLVPAEAVVDGTVVRMADAYPVYDPGYRERVATVRDWLARIENLQVAGRGGMHRYNNMDHSVLTGTLAARNLLGQEHNVWAVNADDEYLENA